MATSKFVSGEARLSYVQVFEAKASALGGEPKYSITVLMPKSDKASKQRLDAAIEQTMQEAVSKKWGGQRPAKIEIALHDGDGVKANGEPYGAECRGHWVLTASSTNPPEVVDANCNPIINRTDLYSGCYGRVGINPFAYNYQNIKKGIGFGLNTVQKLRDGDPLGGAPATAAEDFGAPAPGYQMPTTPAPAPTPPLKRIDPLTGLPWRD